jgi:hypothetical protein
MSLFAKLIGTNLKSLKWGHLRTQGDSTEPYVTTDINNVNYYVKNRYLNGSNEDNLTIRGGKIGTRYASTVDSVRINRFLKDPLKGPFFLYNQVGLQKSNPLIGQSIYINPPDIESKEIAESIRHYSNGGTSTLAQISKTAYGEHIPRHGDIFSYTPGTYNDIMEQQKKGNNKNKLYNYSASLFNYTDTINGNALIIDEYNGGPNSTYGLGKTTIRRFVYSGKPKDSADSLQQSKIKINNFRSEYQKYFDYSIYKAGDETIINSRITPRPSFNFNKKINYDGTKGLTIQKSELGIGRKLEKPYNKIGSFISEDIKYPNYPSLDGKDIKNRIKPIQPISGSFKNDKGLFFQTSSYATNSQSLEPHVFESIKYKDYSINKAGDETIINSRITPQESFKKSKNKNIFGAYGLIFQKSKLDINRKKEKISHDKIGEFNKNNIKYTNFSGFADFDTPTGSIIYDGEFDINSRIIPQKSFKPNPTTSGVVFQTTKYSNDTKLEKLKPYAEFKSPETLSKPSQEVKYQKAPNLNVISRGKTSKAFYDYNIKNTISSYVTGSGKMADKGIYGRDDSNILSVEFSQINPFSGEINTSQSFSGYINGYSENYTSNWNDIKYNGRAEFLYNFVSYKKTVAFSLQIPIFRSEDLLPTHNKIKELQSGLAGKYSSDSRLGGVITRIKLGYYLNNQYCIINSINIKIPDEASWDWDGILARSTLLDASFNITVIDDKIPTG